MSQWEYFEHICLLYRGQEILGYVNSYTEADWICEKLDTDVQWDYCTKKQLPKIPTLNFVTINDFIK